MNSQIPRAVVAVVADVIGLHYYSHRQLDRLFKESGAPGSAPAGNCVDKCRSWFLTCNKDPETDAFEVLGNVLLEFMDISSGTSEDDDVQAGRERIKAVLAENRLTYSRGGKVADDASFARESCSDSEVEKSLGSMNKKRVFVVHGRNEKARKAMFAFLRSIRLDPIEWSEALKMTDKPAPYIGEVLDKAFEDAAAVVVLLTGDDEARLKGSFLKDGDASYEGELTPQARANVLFEAGMAFGTHAERTILVQLGELRPFSDVGGRYICHLDDSTPQRQMFAQKLEMAGCELSLDGTDWHAEGEFDKALPAEGKDANPTF